MEGSTMRVKTVVPNPAPVLRVNSLEMDRLRERLKLKLPVYRTNDAEFRQCWAGSSSLVRFARLYRFYVRANNG